MLDGPKLLAWHSVAHECCRIFDWSLGFKGRLSDKGYALLLMHRMSRRALPLPLFLPCQSIQPDDKDNRFSHDQLHRAPFALYMFQTALVPLLTSFPVFRSASAAEYVRLIRFWLSVLLCIIIRSASQAHS